MQFSEETVDCYGQELLRKGSHQRDCNFLGGRQEREILFEGGGGGDVIRSGSVRAVGMCLESERSPAR